MATLTPKPLSDEEVTGILERIYAKSVEEHVEILIGTHKIAEDWTSGKTHELLQHEAVLLISLLNRVLPGVVDRTLDDWAWSDLVEQLEEGDDA